MNKDQNDYFNEIFGSISSSKDVRIVFSLVEYLASIEHTNISIDCIISAILFYYKDEHPEDFVTKLYPAALYYQEFRKTLENSDVSISFANFANEKPLFQPYCPQITDDVETLFTQLYDYDNMTITIPFLLFVICEICTTKDFQKLPLICANRKNFDKLHAYLRKNFQYISAYNKELTIPCGTDMTFNADKYDPIIGRETEISHILRILSKRTKNNPLLIGEPGVGKTHIVESLAKRFVSGQVPQRLLGKKIVSLNIAELISGTKYRGELEEKVQNFLDVISATGVIVFIDELHTLFHDSSNEDLASILKPALLNPNVCIIGTTTNKEYRIIEKDPAFARRFDVVRICEPTINEAIEILQGLQSIYEDFHSVEIPSQVIEDCVKLSNRYISTSSLPDKAIDILDEACSKLECNFDLKRPVLTTNVICEIITEKTGISISDFSSSKKEKLLKLEPALNAKIIGQDHAISNIVRAIKRATLDLQDSNKPIASFLFAGTTGIGKTETAKVLASEFFQDPHALIRLDMSEYQTKETVTMLTGSSPGYVGYEEGGQLTNAVKRRPYSIILFDEIEKAHPDVLDILLQILDDGRLTDNTGTTVNFKNTIVILTTNIGAEEVQKNVLGFSATNTSLYDEKTIISEIKKVLRPELINRLSNIVVYNSLTKSDCEKIVKIYLENFQNKLHTKGIELKYSVDLPQQLVEKGYDKTYGARELKRTFEHVIVDNVTDLILTKNPPTIYIDSSFNLSISAKNANIK